MTFPDFFFSFLKGAVVYIFNQRLGITVVGSYGIKMASSTYAWVKVQNFQNPELSKFLS